MGSRNDQPLDRVIEDGYNGPGREYFLNLRVNY